MSSRVKVMSTILCSVFACQYLALAGSPVPLELARPDDQPGNPKKPVKVYILAGQSNMVGMGDISGASAEYPSVFLAADPAILPGVMPVGSARQKSACKWIWKGLSALAAHGVYQSAEATAEKGAVVAVHQGAYDPKADYSKLTPAKTDTVALGTVAATLPVLNGPCTPVVTAFIDVPATGTYAVHAGFGESTHAVVVLEGKEVYRKDPGSKAVVTKVNLETGKRYPVQITYFKGGSAAFWMEQVNLVGKGDLVTLTKKDGKFQYLIDADGKWTVRRDVSYIDPRLFPTRTNSLLSAISNNGKSIGPEVGFGFVMGEFHDEQILVIKTAMGNRSLGFDFRPPSSGRTDPDSEYEGLEYRLMVEGVRKTLADIDKVIPGYAGQGYEIAGFGWFQGHKDSGSTKEAYEQNLVNLIKDLRQAFNAPKMPVVVAAVGFEGYRLYQGPWKGVWEAQMAVGDPAQHPTFAGTVTSVDTRDFWREVAESPRSQNYHYHRNPETYLLVGEAMGRAMVRMHGGEAASIPKSDRDARTAADVAAEAAKPIPTPEQVAASLDAIKPMLLDGMFEKFVNNPKTTPALLTCINGMAKPAISPEFLDDVIDDAVAYLQVAGIDAYDWKPFGGNIKEGTWEYAGFDLPNSPYKASSAGASVVNDEGGDSAVEEQPIVKTKGAQDASPSLQITLPSAMENWFMPAFDTKTAGWQRGAAPFGVQMDEMVPTNIAWIAKYPPYPLKRTLAKTIIDNDVLLMRKTIDVPPLKDGYRYRIRLDGSVHDNSGEGYAIYVNGRLLVEQKSGVTGWRKQGVRGSHVWTDFRDEFNGGTVTIAVVNFPMNNWTPGHFIPAVGPLSVWVEEMKLPPLGN